MNNCNLKTCRYNADGKCTNEEKREECVRVAKAVLCVDGTIFKEISTDRVREYGEKTDKINC